jgi:hypothetical protein
LLLFFLFSFASRTPCFHSIPVFLLTDICLSSRLSQIPAKVFFNNFSSRCLTRSV